MTVKNPTSWIPQPEGFGYVTDFTGVSLTTDKAVVLTTNLGVPLATGGSQVTGKFATTWGNTGS